MKQGKSWGIPIKLLLELEHIQNKRGISQAGFAVATERLLQQHADWLPVLCLPNVRQQRVLPYFCNLPSSFVTCFFRKTSNSFQDFQPCKPWPQHWTQHLCSQSCTSIQKSRCLVFCEILVGFFCYPFFGFHCHLLRIEACVANKAKVNLHEADLKNHQLGISESFKAPPAWVIGPSLK